MWQFRLRPLVLHSFSCGYPPQRYLVTAESALAAPADDLLSIDSPRGSDACHATEVAYTPSDFIGRPQWRTQRWTAAVGAQPNPAGWKLDAARSFSQRRQALYSLHLLRTGSAPPFLLIKQTPNKRCIVQLAIRNDLTGW
jgi:hypothetical protein